MDVWVPARFYGQDHKRYFLLVVFPLHSKADVRGVLILWIRTVCCQLSAWFQKDLQ
ncbi:unnamed protein product, partial [Closterium sp. NIES-53]